MRLPIDPEVSPSDLGPLVLAKQQVVLEQQRERLKVLHAQAALKQQQADLRNDAQFNPTSEIKFAEGDMVMVRVFVKQDAFAPRWYGPYEVKAVCHSCIAVAIRGKLSVPAATTVGGSWWKKKNTLVDHPPLTMGWLLVMVGNVLSAPHKWQTGFSTRITDTPHTSPDNAATSTI
ncbi:hypothetical protein SKAU_G00266780 [Synaphobranchus kaupii]|uniref:Murine leukemia virus integrase C-terminal domain-containing protein n=1 Tax=Synaphobranchus kaupii TaxID=118154 RepID=A0A9Q1IQ77_SYNKA|nr:hypothetical protein SKAU_G00266780 [Synaphobranchus kaupii]